MVNKNYKILQIETMVSVKNNVDIFNEKAMFKIEPKKSIQGMNRALEAFIDIAGLVRLFFNFMIRCFVT